MWWVWEAIPGNDEKCRLWGQLPGLKSYLLCLMAMCGLGPIMQLFHASYIGKIAPTTLTGWENWLGLSQNTQRTYFRTCLICVKLQYTLATVLSMSPSETLFIWVSFHNGHAQLIFFRKQGLEQGSYADNLFWEIISKSCSGPGKSKTVRSKSPRPAGNPMRSCVVLKWKRRRGYLSTGFYPHWSRFAHGC